MKLDKTKQTLAVTGGIGLLAWSSYKESNSRIIPSQMPAETGCGNDPNTAADMSLFNPGAPAISCEPWDIGTGVAGYVWHAPNPKAVLLLQHGLGEYAQRYVRQYNRLIPNLLNAGISVYAIDLWGHGHSPGGRAVTDVNQAIEDHLAASRKLQGQALPVFVMGHSLGGLVTAGSVIREGNGVSGAIMSSAALHVDSTAITRSLAMVAATVAPTLPTVKLGVGGMTRVNEQIESIEKDEMIYHEGTPMLLGATILKTSHDNWKLYPNWRVPVLVVHGTADTVTDPAGSRKFFDTIASEDKTLHLVEGGYHELLNDTDQDETLQVILRWLEQRLPRNRT